MVSIRTYEPVSTDRSRRERSEVSILLDTYDDIFSDFDPSPYSERSLSDDFIAEVKKLMANKDGKKKILVLMMPENERVIADEKVIVERLHDYFRTTEQQLAGNVRKVNKRGVLLTLFGSLVMLVAGYISFIDSRQFYAHLLFVLFEPAGWFLLWAGLEHLVYSSSEQKKDLRFYSDMVNAEIQFCNI